MLKGNNWQSSANCIVKFLFCVADTIRTHRAISPGDNQEVVVAVVNYALDERKLILIGCGKQLHSCRYAVQFDDSLDDRPPLFFQVSVCRTHEHLITLVHNYALLDSNREIIEPN